MDLDIEDYAYEDPQTLIPKKPKQKEVFLKYIYIYMGFEMNSVEFDYVCCWNLELDWCVLVVFFVGLVKIINIYGGLC